MQPAPSVSYTLTGHAAQHAVVEARVIQVSTVPPPLAESCERGDAGRARTEHAEALERVDDGWNGRQECCVNW